MKNSSRRKALLALSAAPALWTRPVVDSVVLPGHARSTPTFQSPTFSWSCAPTGSTINAKYIVIDDRTEETALSVRDASDSNSEFGNDYQFIRMELDLRYLDGSWASACDGSSEASTIDIGVHNRIGGSISPSGTQYEVDWTVTTTSPPCDCNDLVIVDQNGNGFPTIVEFNSFNGVPWVADFSIPRTNSSWSIDIFFYPA